MRYPCQAIELRPRSYKAYSGKRSQPGVQKKKRTLEQTFRKTRRMKRALGSVAYLANVVLITPTGEEPWVQLGIWPGLLLMDEALCWKELPGAKSGCPENPAHHPEPT